MPAWFVLTSTGALLAFTASILVVRVAPAATGAGVALVMANLNGRDAPYTSVPLYFIACLTHGARTIFCILWRILVKLYTSTCIIINDYDSDDSHGNIISAVTYDGGADQKYTT